MIKNNMMLSIIILLFAALAVAGEYYQYTDENGKLRFTDDISNVPKAQREDLKKFKATTSKEKIVETTQAQDNKNIEADTTAKNDIKASSEVNTNSGDTFQEQAEKLNAMQDNLNKMRISLEKEREAVQASAPKRGASNDERIKYAERVDALNSRIAHYEKELKAFGEKVNAFNNSRREQRGE